MKLPSKSWMYAALLAVVSILAVCAAVYVKIEALVAYEKLPEKDSTVMQSTADSLSEKPDGLPYSKSYVLRLQDGQICVYNADNEIIYSEKASAEMLSDDDIQELEREGLTLTARSEVMELLSYLKS